MPSDLRSVAAYAPMKRGLKEEEAHLHGMLAAKGGCCSLCPDEKGTERHINRQSIRIKILCRCSLCPDEKGTERPRVRCGRFMIACVAAYAPMKRGLKADAVHKLGSTRLSCSLCPDEKGTESHL